MKCEALLLQPKVRGRQIGGVRRSEYNPARWQILTSLFWQTFHGESELSSTTQRLAHHGVWGGCMDAYLQLRTSPTGTDAPGVFDACTCVFYDTPYVRTDSVLTCRNEY